MAGCPALRGFVPGSSRGNKNSAPLKFLFPEGPGQPSLMLQTVEGEKNNNNLKKKDLETFPPCSPPQLIAGKLNRIQRVFPFQNVHWRRARRCLNPFSSHPQLPQINFLNSFFLIFGACGIWRVQDLWCSESTWADAFPRKGREKLASHSFSWQTQKRP